MASDLIKKKYFFNTIHAEMKVPIGALINSVGSEDFAVVDSGNTSFDTKNTKMATFFVEFLQDPNSPKESRLIDIYEEGVEGSKKTDKHIGKTNVHGQIWHFFERRPDLR